MGHEIAGTIVAVGSGIDTKKYKVGSDQLYVVHAPNSCGECGECRSGLDNVCTHRTLGYGIGLPGGYQQYVAVALRDLITVPAGVSAAVAAAATDAVLTPYEALKKCHLNKLSRVLIIGLGGLGFNAVQIAQAFGAHVTAFDIRPEARELARSVNVGGNLEVLDSLTIKDSPKDYDLVVDVVGKPQTFNIACKQAKVNGMVIPLGLGSPRVSFSPGFICEKQLTIQGSFGGSLKHQAEVFDLMAKGLVTPHVETAKFKDANEVLAKLERGEIKSRVALVDFDDVEEKYKASI